MYWEDRKNMQKSIIRKGLVFLVIILFIGIAVAPGVTSIEFSKDKTSNDDLVEINLQLCKTSGVEDHKMYITQEQNEQLDLLIERFKVDLYKAETREETIEIYKDMVVSLDKLGILPESTNCKEVQELVTGENSFYNPEKIKSNKNFNQAYERLKNKSPELFENMNMFCLLTGDTTNTLSVGLGTVFSLIWLFSVIIRAVPFMNLVNKFEENKAFIPFIFTLLFLLIRYALPLYFSFITPIFSFIQPLKIAGIMTFGSFYLPIEPPWADPEYTPAEGWVSTIGLIGKKTWDGSLYGNFKIFIPIPNAGFFLGAIGFTGIRILEKDFYQGAALWVKLTNDAPS